MLDLLGLILQSFSRIYLIIDGLDECEDPEKVVATIGKLCLGATQFCVPHVLFVSQKMRGIVESLQPYGQIDLDHPDFRRRSLHDVDIAISGILHRSKNPAVTSQVDRLKTSIIQRHGDFILLATMAASHLVAVAEAPKNILESDTLLLQAAKELPPKAENLILHLLEQCFLGDGDGEKHAYALCIFQWVLWSRRPLHIHELALALAVAASGEEASENGYGPMAETQIQMLRHQIGTLCYPLITVQQDGSVAVVHSAFKEVISHRPMKELPPSIELVISKLEEPVASLQMAKTCLRYLNGRQFHQFAHVVADMPNAKIFDARYPFFDYATFHWTTHWRRCDRRNHDDPNLNTLFKELIRGRQGLVWLEGYRARCGLEVEQLVQIQMQINHHLAPHEPRDWLLVPLEKLFVEQQKLLGRKHPITRRLSHTLAQLLTDYGQVQLAHSLYEEQLRGIAPEDSYAGDAIHATSGLASVQAQMGHWQQAEKVLKAIVDKRTQTAGGTAAVTLEAMNVLGMFYCGLHRFKEARRLLDDVVDTRNRTLGEHHPDAYAAHNNLAWAYAGTGQLKKAEDIFLKLTRSSSYTSGGSNLQLLWVKVNLASVYSNLGAYQNAESLQREVLQTRTVLLGKTHRNTITIRNNLAWTLHEQGRYSEAADMLEQAIDISARFRGPQNPSTLHYISNLGLVYEKQNRRVESRERLEYVLKAREKVLGREHHDYLSSLGQVANLYKNEGQPEKAGRYLVQIAKSMSSLFGPLHRQTLEALQGLATTCLDQGRFLMATELMTRVVSGRKMFGESRPDLAMSIAGLGLYKQLLGEYAEADVLIREAIAMGENTWGINDENFLSCRRNLAGNL